MNKNALCIDGLPLHVDLESPHLYSIREALQRDVFAFSVTDASNDYGEKYKFDISLKNIPAHWEKSPRGQFYDPQHFNINEFQRIQSKNPDVYKAPDGREDGFLFRGMSHEEFCQARERGYFESRGDHNLGSEQEGLTYFSKDKAQASHYASGFAPWQFKATVEHPAVMVKIKDPGNHMSVAGTGEDEVGLRGRVPFSLMVGAYLAHPIAVDPGYLEIVEQSWPGSKKYTLGSASGMSVSTQWTPEMAPEELFLPSEQASFLRAAKAKEMIAANEAPGRRALLVGAVGVGGVGLGH